MIARVDGVSSLAVRDGDSVRKPNRRWRHVNAEFIRKFDWETLVYDSFRVDDRVTSVCPPLRNLRRQLISRISESGMAASRVSVREYDRFDVVDFRAHRVEPARTVDGDFPRPTSGSSHDFANKRVLVTMSKDNPLPWIRDWVRFHVRFHGANAVLLYDNGSAYRPAAVADTLAGIAGLDVAVVVDWRFPFGPQGGFGVRWDSDFCQVAALNHARLKYLPDAAGVLSIDVDELVVSESGANIFDALTSSGAAALTFRGTWITSSPVSPSASVVPLDERRHEMFGYRDSTPGLAPCPVKWIAVPSRVTGRGHFRTHEVHHSKTKPAAGFSYRHFRAINTSWKYMRDSDAVVPDPSDRDPLLAEHFRTMTVDHT